MSNNEKIEIGVQISREAINAITTYKQMMSISNEQINEMVNESVENAIMESFGGKPQENSDEFEYDDDFVNKEPTPQVAVNGLDVKNVEISTSNVDANTLLISLPKDTFRQLKALELIGGDLTSVTNKLASITKQIITDELRQILIPVATPAAPQATILSRINNDHDIGDGLGDDVDYDKIDKEEDGQEDTTDTQMVETKPSQPKKLHQDHEFAKQRTGQVKTRTRLRQVKGAKVKAVSVNDGIEK